MGAINFIEVVRGCDSPEDAYKEAVQQALYELLADTIRTTEPSPPHEGLNSWAR
jgi:hypothetical protein